MPARALALSLLALIVPVAATVLQPEWLEQDGALLIWVPLLLPAFLLTYYHGWHGASVSLAAGMAALAIAQACILLLGLGPPRWGASLAIVVLLVAVAGGVGWLGEILHRERARAEASALTDALTGLPNRRHASVFLEASWGAALRGQGLAVVMFDLDGFKRVNDDHGHAAGDIVLRAFGDILRERTRRMDLSARFGGEEFISILVDCSMDQGERFAEEVRAKIGGRSFGWGSITVSAGIAAIEEGMGSPDVLVAAADQALYAAKAIGRNRVQRADQPLPAPPAPPPVPRPPRPAGPEKPRILVTDDDPGTLRATGRLLESMGYSVISAESARSALSILMSGIEVDVLLTDILMPEMSGFTLVELAERVQPGLPVVYVSGYPQDEVYWGGTPGSRHTFLGKPFEIEDLKEALGHLLDGDLAGGAGADADEPGEAAPTPLRRSADEVGRVDRNVNVRGRILIVDDDLAVARALQRIFRRAGYAEPEALTDPTRTVQTVRERDIDLVVLDMHMPAMNGLEVIAALNQAVDPDDYLPILVLTGDSDPEVRRRALAAGARDFLSKPFDTAEAQARVRNLLETRWLNQRVADQRDALEERVMERTAELADTRTEILHRLARAAEYRDDVTGRHAERVGLMASLIASELDVGARDVDLIRRTAPLHDIGKIGVPDRVLRKGGRLNAEEFELMKAHTTIGAQILGGSPHRILQVATKIAASHHERWDGAGYPRGLGGDDIPLAARIVAVADCFDTISHSRPYKEASTAEEAAAEIERESGTHFDPSVVEAFLAIYERVGPGRVHELADPIDPLRDTSGL